VPDDFDLGADAPPDAPAAPPPAPAPEAAEPPAAATPATGDFSDDPTEPLDDATVSPSRRADAAEDAAAGAQDSAPPATPEAPPPSPSPVTGTVQHVAPGEEAGARALLRALGAEDVPLRDEEIVPTMSRLGHVLRIVIEGLREVLMTRTSIKSEFRIQQTMIASGGNNPLKFSISAEQAVEAMVRPKAKGYLDATDAAHQAVQDIKSHEVAMVSGMEAALRGVLKRLDPAELESKIQTGGGLGGMLKSKKARYWEVYEQMYAEISDQAENEFHELFAKEFARAYQDQLDKLK
jgi:type VI secretion system FHA domain protein